MTEGRTGRGNEEIEEKEDKGNDIDKFLGTDTSKLWGWKVQLALKLARKAKTYNTKQKWLNYMVGQLGKAALDLVIPHCDEETREVKLDSM